VTFIEHSDLLERRRSAMRAAKAILGLDLYLAHKRELLSVCIWKITEADGKYTTRFRTRGSLTADRTELQHEHVCERRVLIEELLASPHAADSILERAIGCVATTAEHRSLTTLSRNRPDLDGWDRYREAGIEVVDTALGVVVVHAQPCAQRTRRKRRAPELAQPQPA